jgi:hypothetical protein
MTASEIVKAVNEKIAAAEAEGRACYVVGEKFGQTHTVRITAAQVVKSRPMVRSRTSGTWKFIASLDEVFEG